MTLSSVSSSILSVSLGNYVNGIKWTRKSFTEYLSHWFNHVGVTEWAIEVALSDGWWMCLVSKTGREYSYYIPDTREDERRVFPKFRNGQGL